MSLPYESVAADFECHGADAALNRLAVELTKAKRYRELFATRQMQVRLALGLSATDPGNLADVPEPLRTRLEDGYVEACREVGRLFLADGKIRDAWPYLNVAGDRESVRAVLAGIEPDDERANEVIEIALYEGVWPELGLTFVLKSRGTCNTITTMDGVMHALSRQDQSAAAGLLVRHLHGELLANVRADVARREGKPPTEDSLAGLLANRDWLLADDAYHIDTTHLSATVRFARLLTSPDDLRLAVDLTEYGRRLSRQYQFEGEEPFADFYASHAMYLRALLAAADATKGGAPAAAAGEEIAAAAAYFRARAEGIDIANEGTSAVEHYVALLARVGRDEEAFDEWVRLIPPGVATLGIAPGLVELAGRSGCYEKLIAVSRNRDDPVGFAAALVERPGVARKKC